MAKSYSEDLRSRIIAYVLSGHSRRSAARLFGVSESYAIKALQRVERTGEHCSQPRGRPPGSGKLSPYSDFLTAVVEDRPEITMPELAALLEETHGIRTWPASLSRFLRVLGFSYKKNTDGQGTRTRGSPSAASYLGCTSTATDAA